MNPVKKRVFNPSIRRRGPPSVFIGFDDIFFFSKTPMTVHIFMTYTLGENREITLVGLFNELKERVFMYFLTEVVC